MRGGEEVGEGPANDTEQMNRMRGALHAQLRAVSPNCLATRDSSSCIPLSLCSCLYYTVLHTWPLL